MAHWPQEIRIAVEGGLGPEWQHIPLPYVHSAGRDWPRERASSLERPNLGCRTFLNAFSVHRYLEQE